MVGETVLWERFAGATKSAYGQTRDTWSPPVPVDGVVFSPEATTEPRDGTGTRVVTEATLTVPPGYAPGARDRFTVRGQRYDVEGDPGRPAADDEGSWRNPYTGWSPGTDVRLRRLSDGT